LFAKGAATKNQAKKTKKLSTSSSKQELVKLLDSKRSQSIGILMTSQRLDSQLIKDALINFDNEIFSYETLSAIFAIRPQEDELRCITDYLKAANNNEDLLDKPELFLLELSRIPAFEERLYCLVYQNKFNESLSSIEFRINNINSICEELLISTKIRKILGIILGCGNNMNAANKARGDADGFDLAILPNLKDVKSKDNTSNLVQYIAYYYVNKVDDDLNKFPLPEPSDFNFVAQVSFEELEKEIQRVQKEIEDIEKRIENVFKATSQIDNKNGSSSDSPTGNDQNDQFKKKIDEFVSKASEELKEQEENFGKCKTKFQNIVKLYGLKPKSSDNVVTPEYFFSLWSSFSNDFKNAWKRESQKLSKQRLKEVNEKRNKIKNQTESKPVDKKSIKTLFQQKRTEESKNKH
jgi:hypothetical protein